MQLFVCFDDVKRWALAIPPARMAPFASLVFLLQSFAPAACSQQCKSHTQCCGSRGYSRKLEGWKRREAAAHRQLHYSRCWSLHRPFPALLTTPRTHFSAVRFTSATSTLRSELLLWQSLFLWICWEALKYLLDTVLGHSSSLAIKSCQNALVRLAAQDVAISITITVRLLNWTGQSHIGNLLQNLKTWLINLGNLKLHY